MAAPQVQPCSATSYPTVSFVWTSHGGCIEREVYRTLAVIFDVVAACDAISPFACVGRVGTFPKMLRWLRELVHLILKREPAPVSAGLLWKSHRGCIEREGAAKLAAISNVVAAR